MSLMDNEESYQEGVPFGMAKLFISFFGVIVF